MVPLLEVESASGNEHAGGLPHSLRRDGLSPLQTAQVLRMLDDGPLKRAVGILSSAALREDLLRGLQARYPEALSALQAHRPSS